MRRLLLALVATVFFSSELALAYASEMYGHGVSPGAQGCGYGNQTARGIYSKDDEYRELEKERKEVKKELKNLTKLKSRLKKKVRRHKKKSKRYLKPYAATLVDSHIKDSRVVDGYRGGVDTNLSPACEGADNPYSVNSKFCVPEVGCANVAQAAGMGCHENPVGTPTNTRDEWTNKLIKNKAPGYVDGKICGIKHGIAGKQEQCKEWLEEYSAESEELKLVLADIELKKEYVKDLSEQIADRKDDIRDEVEDGTFIATDDETEAGECEDCSWFSKNSETIKMVAGIGLPILGAYMGYKGAKNISEQNARLGWPTSPYVSANMSYPFIMQGIYGGVMGGMAAGGFGCSGGYYGGARGPYGMGGIGGLYGAGLYGGIGMGAGGGGAFGYPGYMYGGGGPFGMGPYNAGMGPWGIPGPYVNGGFGMGGYPMGGGFGMGGGMGMGGYPMGPMGPMGGGFGMGGYPGMGMGGYPGGGMGMGGYPGGGAMGGMQMQQQYMNMYMQQMQAQMQAQQEYAQKQQVVGRLTQELYKIQMQIQQISSGSYYSGSIPYGNNTLPGWGSSTVPTTGSGGSVIGIR